MATIAMMVVTIINAAKAIKIAQGSLFISLSDLYISPILFLFEFEKFLFIKQFKCSSLNEEYYKYEIKTELVVFEGEIQFDLVAITLK